MTQRTLWVNAGLLVAIGVLTAVISQENLREDDSEVARYADSSHVRQSGGMHIDDRDMLPERQYPSLGEKPLFQPLITPTPPPAPPPPPPPPTPNIALSTANFRVVMVLDGAVTLELRKPNPRFPDNTVTMKPGESVTIDSNLGDERKLTLRSVDETTDPDNPSVTFSLDGTAEPYVMRLFEQPDTTR